MKTLHDGKDKLKPIRNYFNRQLNFIPYIQEDTPSGRRNIIFSWINLVSGWCLIVKFTTLIIIDNESVLVYYLCDPFYKLKEVRKVLNFLLCQWMIAMILQQILIKLTTIKPAKQRWIFISESLENGIFHDYGPFGVELRIFTYFTSSQIIGCAVTSLFLTLPWFSWTERKYWFYGILGMIVHFHGSIMIIGFGPNVSNLGFLTLYLSGKYFEFLEGKLKIGFENEKNLRHHLRKIVSLSRELVDSFSFYQPFACIAFVSSFTAQVLLLFNVFFKQLSLIISLVFFVFFVINYLAGLSMHFFFGSYTQAKVSGQLLSYYPILTDFTVHSQIQSYLKSLFQVAKQTSPGDSLLIIQILEHLDGRYFFVNLPALQLSLRNFFMVSF